MFHRPSLVLLGLFSLVWSSTGLNISDIDEIQQAFSEFRDVKVGSEATQEGRLQDVLFGGGIPSTQLVNLTPVKVPIWDDAIMTFLCDANPDGNYQDPFDCNKFIMCSGRRVFLWQCPAFGAYNPFQDRCLWKGSPSAQCPWRSAWYGDDVNCARLGERPWWSPLTIPVDPDTTCGSRIRYCFQKLEIGTGECPQGYGYCKAYNACLPRAACLALDSWFRL